MKRRAIFLTISMLSIGYASAAHADDMLKPSEIQTTGESANPNNDSGMYLGAGMTFGQSRTTEKDVDPGVGMLFWAEPGYQVNRGSWNRMEFGAELLSGKAAFEKSDVTIPVGILAKIGLGYSLGDKLMALFKIGAGPVFGTFSSSAGAEKVKSDGLVTGLGLQGAWTMVFPMTNALDLSGGLSWTHMEFSVGDVKGTSGAKYSYDRSVIANIPAIDLGVRVRF